MKITSTLLTLLTAATAVSAISSEMNRKLAARNDIAGGAADQAIKARAIEDMRASGAATEKQRRQIIEQGLKILNDSRTVVDDMKQLDETVTNDKNEYDGGAGSTGSDLSGTGSTGSDLSGTGSTGSDLSGTGSNLDNNYADYK
ncbi:Uu.00g112010.m01.CDS01 [Anthostomella pinea]|uniref:Uu.00g112010.m01.CDS01 n=1 Tax=Anthostomella pinea TaxID=933095 RepID=A0AAI8YE02_9PEZI|nr:Uu.00g112010.m01.CDS01 [Anthostomella pinea]